MALLFDEDYVQLEQRGFSFEENESQRFFVFKSYPLPLDLYSVNTCDVLVCIPANYNQAGNDMFWTAPRLRRTDDKPIPATCNLDGGDNRQHNGMQFCRWSRHWNPGTPGVWRSGKDDIISIQRRIEWALRNPDT